VSRSPLCVTHHSRKLPALEGVRSEQPSIFRLRIVRRMLPGHRLGLLLRLCNRLCVFDFHDSQIAMGWPIERRDGRGHALGQRRRGIGRRRCGGALLGAFALGYRARTRGGNLLPRSCAWTRSQSGVQAAPGRSVLPREGLFRRNRPNMYGRALPGLCCYASAATSIFAEVMAPSVRISEAVAFARSAVCGASAVSSAVVNAARLGSDPACTPIPNRTT
jgi:hypothetical protein